MLDALFPARCPGCGREGWPVCVACASRIAVLTPPLCTRCGRPTEQPIDSCADCPPPPIAAARAPFLYEGPLARAIRAMKFSGWHALGAWLGGPIVEALASEPSLLAQRPRVVTWVPLSKRRKAARGFDQAEILARAVGSALDVPVRRLLNRVRDTTAQARLSGAERRSSLRGAFVPVRSVPRRVLLIDDVLTTGATAAVCAEALRTAGATRVVLATAARSLGRGVPERCRV